MLVPNPFSAAGRAAVRASRRHPTAQRTAPFRGAPRAAHLLRRNLMKRASAGLCLLLLLGCQRQRPAAVRPPAAPAAEVPADEDQPPMTQVTGHRWWRVEVEPDD